MQPNSPARYAVLWSIFALLAVVLVYPIWLTVRGAFTSVQPDGGFTTWHVIQVFRDPDLRAGLFNALLIASCTTVISILVSMPLAVIAAKYKFLRFSLSGNLWRKADFVAVTISSRLVRQYPL